MSELVKFNFRVTSNLILDEKPDTSERANITVTNFEPSKN